MTDDDFDDAPVEPKTREEWALLVAQSLQDQFGDDTLNEICRRVHQFGFEGNNKAVDTYAEIAMANLKILEAKYYTKQ